MRKILLESFGNVKKILLALTLMFVINFIAGGQVELVAAIFIGYMLAGFYIFSTAARLENIMKRKRQASKREMIIGVAMRLVMIFIVFGVAIKISKMIFFTTVIGFLTFYAVVQIGLILHSYKTGYTNETNKK